MINTTEYISGTKNCCFSSILPFFSLRWKLQDSLKTAHKTLCLHWGDNLRGRTISRQMCFKHMEDTSFTVMGREPEQLGTTGDQRLSVSSWTCRSSDADCLVSQWWKPSWEVWVVRDGEQGYRFTSGSTYRLGRSWWAPRWWKSGKYVVDTPGKENPQCLPLNVRDVKTRCAVLLLMLQSQLRSHTSHYIWAFTHPVTASLTPEL